MSGIPFEVSQRALRVRRPSVKRSSLQGRVVSNTGAYGGHAGETLVASLGSPMCAYRCDNKKATGHAVYTNVVPGGTYC
jgi:CO/xanthine dehydrogenase Mo-binding subunit